MGETLKKESVALIGKFDSIAKARLLSRLSDDFNIREITCEEFYDKLKDVQYIILRTLKIDANTIKKNPQLKLIQRWGVGYDTVDIRTAGEYGIQVAITYGVNSIPVAEYTVLLMLSVLRNIIQVYDNVKNGLWQDTALFERSYLINKKKVGLVGLGAIGKNVAKILGSMGSEIYYYDSYRLPEDVEKELNVKYLPFEDLAKEVDILSLHVPLNQQTKYMVNKKVIDTMKSTAIIINTSRGGIINEEDLYYALKDKRILGAGLDVFEKEPISRDNHFLQLKNVVVSAHSAGNTIDNSINMANICADNIFKVKNNEPLSPSDLVNSQFISNKNDNQ